MKVIKDNMPSTYESKEGSISFLFGCSYGLALKKNDVIVLPIRPNLIFIVDGKDVGEFQCENTVEIKYNLPMDEIYKAGYAYTLSSIVEFNTFVRTQFAIPPSVTLKLPSFELIKPDLAVAFMSINLSQS